MDGNLDHIIPLIERLHQARLIREWDFYEDGLRIVWNDEFRDGQGAKEALCVVHDVLRALEIFPPLRVSDLAKMCDLASGIHGTDEADGDL